MRKFNVTVNGKSYTVEVEEIGAAATASAPAAAPVGTAGMATAAGTAAPVTAVRPSSRRRTPPRPNSR